MAREIRFNAFVVGRPVHQSPGLWRHPRDRSTAYKDLDYWVDLARTLERGLFDAIFLADGIGPNDVYGGNLDAALTHGSQVPTNDPTLLIPAMAHATRNLGFAVTGNLSFEPPYLFARRFSTLDQLTRGRVGWNIVTGKSSAGAKGMGRDAIVPHDQRYDIADEFMEVVYKLWEGSWEDDAVLWDREEGVFARPEKVHRVSHQGTHYKLDAIHLTEPSPQRTPVLFQAGGSTRGRAFAARHAEGVFLAAPTKTVAAKVISDVRRRAAENGRHPDDLLFFPLMTVIVGENERAAQAKLEEYRSYISHEGALVLFSGWTGIDLAGRDLDEVLRYEDRDNGVVSTIEAFTVADPNRQWTLRDIARHAGIGGQGPVIVGSPEQVADEIEAWVEETGADGFNLAYAVAPETYVDFIDLVVPELQRRGAYKRQYAAGTYREKLFGPGHARLAAPHPGAAFRYNAA
ncbi:LLM class flavin-dependent oxidoreductase [Chelatococcus sp. YT9]|uniref:LLM class flavin-dependent oxidoreductase n=1 Tax=Chelatococcus sp. YT9 TaxID=2835635 RepID=UPI001BCABDA2|nr:LLM class flavin-dependent oxidoreductase [Chelatococcus sp. YT9]MBS7699058.1 LLM class flavin-dependent oxidoreductase [Chelatococcus sp. YT9]